VNSAEKGTVSATNVRLPLGPLRAILGAPELHHWHHAKDRDAGNYGNVCPLMDLIFGTHVCPDHEPESFGLNTPSPKTWLGHMIQPLLPRRKKAKPTVAKEREDAAHDEREATSCVSEPQGELVTACSPGGATDGSPGWSEAEGERNPG
jgi:hypothetical protein